jgi:hypothetical protein
MEDWSDGMLERANGGKLESWNIGIMGIVNFYLFSSNFPFFQPSMPPFFQPS